MNDQYDLYCLQHIENTVHSKVEEADDVFCACAKYLAMMHKTIEKSSLRKTVSILDALAIK